ncbi:putative DUF3328 domain-containing protein [Seiridium cardinale]|uniref:DUF3328 domain-containing protein n=1 Tax=Seiridium cardinale TaxID=138064 RepID=A0ABR2XNF6_9PEZI
MSFVSEPSQRAAFLKNEADPELNSSSHSHRGRSQAKRCDLLRTISWPWILSTVFFACTTALLLLRTETATGPHAGLSPCADDPRGVPVAFGVGNKRVEVTFTGALTYNSSGDLIAEYVPGQRRWAGEPSPYMDEAWDDLTEFWTVLLDGEEADNVRGQTLLQNGYWVTGLDVFHQLHCLDSLRRAVYPDYYPHEGSPRTWQLHVDHCVDYLRQAIMCHGDTTPVHYKWFPGIRRWGPDFASTHYCPREMEDLLTWSRTRTPKARAGVKGKETTVINGAVVDDMTEEGEGGDKLDLDGGHEHHHGK